MIRYGETENTYIWKKRIEDAEMRRERNLLAIQRICGILMVGIGVIIPILWNGDATFSLFAIPIGLYLIISNAFIMERLAYERSSGKDRQP